MSAEVEAMMYAGEVPWHGLGTAIPMEVTSEEAIKLAGLDWEVETAPIISNDQKRTAVEDWRITRRITDNAVLGVVKKNFTPIQNRDAFKMFDAVNGRKEAIYHTAGSLRGGSKVWILAKLPEVIEVGKGVSASPDEVQQYLLLSNSHDGTLPLQMLFTPVRVVCSNTLSLALHRLGDDDELQKTVPRVTIRHTRNADRAMKEASKVMGRALAYYKQFGDFAGFLHSRQVNQQQVDNIIGLAFPPNKKKIVTPTVLQHRLGVENLFTEGAGHDKIAGSAWALLNAFAEYADHSYSLRSAKAPEDRSYSIWMGGAKGLKQRAEKLIVEAVS
jgi:phage/plasmid-like protein (TIGR03299 family)